ncbi:hypothetical protein [Streptomyces ficellus]|uniref:Protein kinase domain-containing protein n=1 Tax=Streptomyces ficellus TaxID=1977088 RepID=A0A6I6F8T7_9ACTN|nr:hypothetical protein [Streptomyces ficellus]QGV79451.1 hypothetical protein EIZ62_15255 [Streptomyces ficellus]
MSEEIRIPDEAVASAESHCGRPVRWDLISSRRGSVVWKGVGPSASVALKAGQGDGAPITSREITVAERLPGHSPLIASGRTEATTWLITPWHHGPSTWDVFHTVRTTHQGTQEARDAAVDLCLAVADLHRQGWVHGDLQPDHAIHTRTGIQLIDWTWATSRALTPSRIFRGGLPHLLAPELAAEIKAGHRPVKVTPAAETYTLTATLWRSATGTWPFDYTAACKTEGSITGPGARQLIASGQLPPTLAPQWPAVLSVLRIAMAAPPEARPSASDLALLIADAAQ